MRAHRGRRGVDLLVRGPDFAPAASHRNGPKPENAFRRIASLRAFTHKRPVAKVLRTFSTSPHRFAFYPSAPLRQPVLRTSSWLAPSFATTRPCDRPVKKTRDAFNRRLPPKRKRAPAPRAFPTRSAAFAAWTPTETKAPYEMIGDPKVSRPSRPLRRTVLLRGPRPQSLAGWRIERGRCLPTAHKRSSL
jgi:hypothetical protein